MARCAERRTATGLHTESDVARFLALQQRGGAVSDIGSDRETRAVPRMRPIPSLGRAVRTVPQGWCTGGLAWRMTSCHISEIFTLTLRKWSYVLSVEVCEMGLNKTVM